MPRQSSRTLFALALSASLSLTFPGVAVASGGGGGGGFSAPSNAPTVDVAAVYREVCSSIKPATIKPLRNQCGW